MTIADSDLIKQGHFLMAEIAKEAVIEAQELIKLNWLINDCSSCAKISEFRKPTIDVISNGATPYYGISCCKSYYSRFDGKPIFSDLSADKGTFSMVIVNEKCFEFSDKKSLIKHIVNLINEYIFYFKIMPSSVTLSVSERTQGKYGFLMTGS